MSKKKALREAPTVHPTATIVDCEIGIWTEIGARTQMVETILGDYSYVVNDANIIYARIGKFCSIAGHTRINPGNHPLDRAALHHWTYRAVSYQLGDEDDAEFFDWRRSHQVVLGHDVWIGHGAIILPNVHIGTGAAIGAGAVVSKDLPPFAVAVGAPARVVRQRFDDALCQDLLDLAWWDWPRDRLRAALPDFRKLSAREFVEKHAAA